MPANQVGRFLCRIFGDAILRAGQLLKIDVIDHVIIGNPGYSSLRSLGYCAV
jgi:DNA repair protein RadC